ncbi:CCT_1a_G0025970.mRNA.1.CDS.1 [Saccharomyces cerevisiae]|nr:CCT_1a_G0025970.mRNA.1.CDS.1 [Saccharomyces cerevisiae]CAI7347826.1 CCT_1a_G0025970.mRNA.1.CDS.1 [Saccharomyces cerevisiae]
MASWWCVQQGYNNHRLNAAAISQINKMSHVMFGGITHKAGIDFLRATTVTLLEPYQFRDPVNSRHNTYNGFLAENIFCKAPEVRFDCREKDVEKLVEELDVKPFAEIIDKHHSEISGVVMESIVQGAGGLRMYHPYFPETCPCTLQRL